jgi:4-amino-4-deoxy-L-arabinose transferase-like glycosyltransferase
MFSHRKGGAHPRAPLVNTSLSSLTGNSQGWSGCRCINGIVTTTLQAPPAATATDESPVYTRAPATKWDRAGLAILLIGTAVMYLWNITVNGMGNQFYAGAAQAGSKDWEALLFGSLDSGNFITVDKPPVAQWVMGLSGQLFGFSSASMLVPEALMAVAAVALLYGAVSRISGRRAGLLAGAVLALTPVAALMFRFNNPDAAMVLLMMAAAYCTVRALERASARWMAWAGVALGFAFLAKMLEGLMVVPAVGLAYLIAAPTSLRRRLLHLLVAFVAFVISSGWFVLVTLMWPESSRPFIAGSTDNNFMNLVLGYNGFARVLGRNRGPFDADAYIDQLTGAGGHGGFGIFGAQSQGLPRLFSGEFGFEIGWLIPAALLAAALVFVARRRAPRTDRVRAGAILFGTWIVVDGVVLSFMHGMIHAYYCLSLAPAVAGIFAIGVHEMWRGRESWFCRLGLVAMILTTGVWSWWILGRNGSWMPALRWTILALTVVVAVTMLMALASHARRRTTIAAVALGLTGALAGPAAYAIATIGQPHSGGGPIVGPASAEHHGVGGMFGGMFGQQQDNPALDTMLAATHTQWSAAISGSSPAAGLELHTNTAVMAIGGFAGRDPAPTLSQFQDDVTNHRIGYYVVQDRTGRGGGPFGGPTGRGHSDITKWVSANFAPVRVGSATVYDLSAPKT